MILIDFISMVWYGSRGYVCLPPKATRVALKLYGRRDIAKLTLPKTQGNEYNSRSHSKRNSQREVQFKPVSSAEMKTR